MTIEELVREGLAAQAEATAAPPELAAAALRRGRRRRATRRRVLAAATIAAVGLASAAGISQLAGKDHRQLEPAHHADVVATPWWKSWRPMRHNGPVDHALIDSFLNQDPRAHLRIRVYAAGTTPDGTSYAFFTENPGPHRHDINAIESTDGGGGFEERESPDQEPFGQPRLDWFAGLPWVQPTYVNGRTISHGKWLIVVGRPGTTRIDYAPDGVHWQPMEVRQGIGELFIKNDIVGIPRSYRVRLADRDGWYVRSGTVGPL